MSPQVFCIKRRFNPFSMKIYLENPGFLSVFTTYFYDRG
ncbi:Uncharacterized protein dnm_083060 [Desulfonema magnum]|uniref:Uncharacterized protein n=1 Tax=Desulfonema magnum TaxID=45655 RepID=A0A975BW42_9BACT|nr:Uncharacterized protein dnm_083060 [Desulfonema magnum]